MWIVCILGSIALIASGWVWGYSKGASEVAALQEEITDFHKVLAEYKTKL